MRSGANRNGTRGGFTLSEVIFVLVIVFVAIMLILLMLPRSRETARLNACAKSLGQIGQALAQHESAQGRFPGVDLAGGAGTSPQAALLRMSSLRREAQPEAKRAQAGGKPVAAAAQLPPLAVADLICPSDTGPALPRFPAPTSYRANTGSTPQGENGPFAPGAQVSVAEVVAGDGADYTLAFAERLVGTGADGQPGPRDYALVDLPFVMDADGYPAVHAGEYQGDAGSDTALPRWSQTLYTHALPPLAPRTVVARDGTQAYVGVSSGHAGGIQTLLVGGSVRLFTRSVDARVWAQYGSYRDGQEAGSRGSAGAGVAEPPAVEALTDGPRGPVWDRNGEDGSTPPR
jgi:type II secretory pathway pseudopilin PulG